MRGVAFLALVILVVATTGDVAMPASASSEPQQWSTAAGKPPSKNEFAAVVAACKDRANSETSNTLLEGCLAGYGLHRVQ